MFFRLHVLVGVFALTHSCLATIIRCLPPEYPINGVIDGIWEDCGFEGPIPQIKIGDEPSAIQTMSFDFSNERSASASRLWLNFLISNRATPGGLFDRNDVKEVIFEGTSWYGFLPLVEHVFERLGGLEIVRWKIDQPISYNILRSLEKRTPEVKIYYEIQSGSYETRRARDLGLSLSQSPLLYSLKTSVQWYDEDEYEVGEFVRSALANAKGLKELDLWIYHRDCQWWGAAHQSFPLMASSELQLEVLKLSGCELDETSTPSFNDGRTHRAKKKSRFDWFHNLWKDEADLAEPDDEQSNLDTWLKTMDWSSLNTLHLTWPSKSTLGVLKDHTPSLTNLSLTVSDSFGNANADEILLFVPNAQHLHSLDIKSWQIGLGDSILESFIADPNLTQELRHFSYQRGQEYEGVPLISQNLTTEFLRSALKLESLGIELPRDVNVSMDEGLFRDMMDSRTLRKITLRFNSPDIPTYQEATMYETVLKYVDMATMNGIDDELDPLFNRNTALVMFKDMRASKQGAELEELELYVGDWDGREYRDTRWLKMRVGHWVCNVSWGEEICQGSQTRLSE